MQLRQKIKAMRCVPQKKARDQRRWNESCLQQREGEEKKGRHRSGSVNKQPGELELEAGGAR